MIGRRALLTALVGAPVVGKAAIAKAATIAASGAATVGQGNIVAVETSPLARAAMKHMQRLRNARERKNWAGQQASRGELPFAISSKRSWSPTYKAHVALRESELESLDYFDLDEATLIKVARVLGFQS